MKNRIFICCTLLALSFKILALNGFERRLRSKAIHELRGGLNGKALRSTDYPHADAFNQPSTSVIVTGANGVLGRSFVR